MIFKFTAYRFEFGWRARLQKGTTPCRCLQCRRVINKPHPFKGLNFRMPMIIPIKGRGSIHDVST